MKNLGRTERTTFAYASRAMMVFTSSSPSHSSRALMTIIIAVVCDESGQIKFPFSYVAHVTRLTLAQARLSRCSGWLTFAHPNYHFRQAAAQPTKRFNSSRRGPELVPSIKMARMYPILGPNSLRMLLFFHARDPERSLFSKSPTYNSHKHASHYLALSLSTYLHNKL